MKKGFIYKTLIATIPVLALFTPHQANAQIVPQPWVSVGAKDGDITYAVGAKALGFGLEVGTGENGATGVDVLKFINLPFISASPYVGVGVYSGDDTFAYSGGVQVGVSKRINLGVGYNSIRGVNGQLGIRLF